MNFFSATPFLMSFDRSSFIGLMKAQGAAQTSEASAPRIFSGIAELDLLTGGFALSELTALGGRPSMGKSTVAYQIARHAATEQGLRVAYFSLEVGKEKLMQRLLAQSATLPVSDLRSGQLSEQNWLKLINVSEALAGAQLFIDDRCRIDVSDIQNAVRELGKSGKVDLVIVDYLQLISRDQVDQSRTDGTNACVKGLKRMAVEENVAVLALSQLNSSFDSDAELKPRLSDLRMVTEYEALDHVILLFRESYFARELRESPLEFHVVKTRSGRVGVAKADWIALSGDSRPFDFHVLTKIRGTNSTGMSAGLLTHSSKDIHLI